MALVFYDRVRETTTVTGTSDATLLGAVTGFQAFSVVGNGNTCYYTIADQSGGNWECGIGTYSSVGPTLQRTTILSSSNSGNKVAFGAGTKDIFLTYPSSKAVYLDASNNAQPNLGNASATQLNITAQGDLRLEDTTGGEYVALQAPGTLASSYTLTLPVDDGTNGQALITDGNGNLSWSTAASGDVYGPASATDNAIARYDGTTGKLIQNSLVTVSDTGAISAPVDASINGLTVGKGGGASIRNTVVGNAALAANTTGTGNSAFGNGALALNTSGAFNTAMGGIESGGFPPLYTNTTGNFHVAIGNGALAKTDGAQFDVAIGYQAMFNNTLGSNNTAVGYQAAFSTTTSDNSAFGYKALYATTTGTLNTAIGELSLTANTTGSSNTALGVQALQANTTASNNTAVGYQAGYSNTTGAENTFLGRLAGFSTSTAGLNTAIGASSGYSNTTGKITAVGAYSLYSNTTGQSNVAVGGNDGSVEAALQANTTGASNVGVGVGSLSKNTTASNNTAVGYQAGYSNTTAALTTAVGAQALFSNTTGAQNTAVGVYASYFNTTGQFNVALGKSALEKNTTGNNNTGLGFEALFYNTTASGNVAIGHQASYSNTTAPENVAIGYQALFSTTTAGGNTAVGYRSMYSTAGGYQNSAIGDQSLYLNTTGIANSAIGVYALYSNTTGINNTGLGHSALYSNTTASNNTAVGYQAGYSNTTGSVITAIGRVALYSNTTGSALTAVGNATLYSNTTGIYNVGVGESALYANTTGSYNTAIGHQALTNNISASYSTALGYGAGLSQNGATGYNTFVGTFAGYSVTSGTKNTFVGSFTGAGASGGAGASVTTGSANTIIGNYNGNQGGLDIRTASNYIVLSDGDGNPRAYWDNSGIMVMPSSNAAITRVGRGGTNNTGGSGNFYYVGKWVIAQAAQANRIRLSFLSTNGYGAGEVGSTTVMGTITNGNDLNLVTYSQVTALGTQSAQVASKYVTDGYEIYVRTGFFSSNSPLVDVTGGYWSPASTDTGSTSAPAGSTNSEYYLAYGFNQGTAAVTMNAYGIRLGTGTLNTDGMGIRFPGPQSASSDANTLDDYEEGTWTPSIQFSGGTTGIIYGSGSPTGTYTKIGNMVYAGFFIALTNKGSSTGSAQLAGLPFTSGSSQGNRMGTVAGFYSNFAAAVVAPLLLVEVSSTIVTLRYSGGGDATAMTDTHFTNNSALYGVVVYQV